MPPSKEVVDLTEMEDSEMEDVQATKTSDRSDASSELSDAPSYPEDPRHLDRPLKFTQLVDMIVGVANVKFSLYPSLINKNSGLLKTVIGVEPGNASIDLSEEDPAAFDTYVISSDETVIKAHNLAVKFADEISANLLFDRILAYSKQEPTFPTKRDIDLVFELTPEDSPLQRCLIHKHLHAGQGGLLDRLNKSFPPAFLLGIAIGDRSEEHKEYVANRGRCHYHIHAPEATPRHWATLAEKDDFTITEEINEEQMLNHSETDNDLRLSSVGADQNSPSKTTRTYTLAEKVEVLIGPARVKFHVVKELIRRRSKFFEAGLMERWRSDDTPIDLSDDGVGPAAFDVYLECVYYNIPRTAIAMPNPFPCLIEGFIVADKLVDIESMNILMDAIVAERDHAPFTSRDIEVIFENTPASSPLRKLVVDGYLFKGRKRDAEDFGDDTPRDLLLEIGKAYLRRDSKRLRKEYNQSRLKCRYHQHDEEHPPIANRGASNQPLWWT